MRGMEDLIFDRNLFVVFKKCSDTPLNHYRSNAA